MIVFIKRDEAEKAVGIRYQRYAGRCEAYGTVSEVAAERPRGTEYARTDAHVTEFLSASYG